MAPDVTLIQTTGEPDLALVHLLQLSDDPRHVVETVDSVDPRYPRLEKSVIILSTQLGCPVGCLLCDAGHQFLGNLTADQMLAQARFVRDRQPDLLNTAKLKVHFARMGEPAKNADAVLAALKALPHLLPNPSLMPCIASVAPRGSESFFGDLARVKHRLYGGGRFQLQLSINSTDPAVRRRLMPMPHLTLPELAKLGEGFFEEGDRKIALNVALARGVPLAPEVLADTFDPARFMVKLTPLNPTERAVENGLQTVLSARDPEATAALVERLTELGFDAVVSIGEPDEIRIGSNCGQLVRAHRHQQQARKSA